MAAAVTTVVAVPSVVPLQEEHHQQRQITEEAEGETTAIIDDTRPCLRIAVGSLNPVKVNAVRLSFAEAYPGHKIEAKGVPGVKSGVADQPEGEEETRRGAVNRALAAARLYQQSMERETEQGTCCGTVSRCDFAVGLEGGVEEGPRLKPDGTPRVLPTLYCAAWMAIYRPAQDDREDGERKQEVTKEEKHTLPSWGLARTASFPLPNEIVELLSQGVELGDADDRLLRSPGSVNNKTR